METFTDDTVVALASFLAPHDMLSLALSCKRFGDKHGMDKKQSAAREESTREVRQRTDTVSLMEVAARTVLHNKWSDEEKNALPRRGDESWIGLYQKLLKLFRLPLQFDKLVGEEIHYYEDTDKTRVYLVEEYIAGTAICSNIMRSGKHYVSFQVNDDDPSTNHGITCGIMRPTRECITLLPRCSPVHEDLSVFSLKDYENLYNDNNVDCCLLDTCMGNGVQKLRWKKWMESELAALDEEEVTRNRLRNLVHPLIWEGFREFTIEEASFKVGMVLDLDEGTLDVYKNDRRLGTLRSGLVGEYCWVVSLKSFGARLSVSIGR